MDVAKMLTVRELIEQLQTMNPDLPVAAECCQSHTTAHELRSVVARRTYDIPLSSQVVVLNVDRDYISTEYGD